MGFGRGFGPGATGDPAAFVENRLAAVKSELKITPAQEGAWTAYADQAKQQSDSARKLWSAMHESGPISLEERIELRDKVWKERQAQAETTAQKLKDLYAALTPEQKAVADRLFGGYGPRAGFGPGYRFR
jgi:Spy/CpxP family protein refolding chaperone